MSTWFPIGPDFVYATRDSASPRRLSRRNEWARQCKVSALAVDNTTSPPTLYTVERPYPQAADTYDTTEPQRPYWPTGGAAFRSDDDGRSWTSIADSLIQATPSLVPSCVAVHPVHANYIYLGTVSGEIHVSNARGDSWLSSQNLGAEIRQIVVDPRGASDPATTTLYAATTAGLQRSTDGGATWLPTTLTGNVMSLAFHMPLAGSADFYAGVYQSGLYHATDPAGTWTSLSGSGSGLPAHSGSNFDGVYVDFARNSPTRVYVVLAGANVTLYTTGTAPTGFVAVTAGTKPPVDLFRNAFAVAPNSPGNGTSDVLFFTGVTLFRSNNAGASWDAVADSLHGDHNCLGFSTASPIPVTYAGCDGGLFASTSLADGTVNVTIYPTDFSDGATYTASGVSQNYNHGKSSLAVASYAADAASAACGYTGAQDTGLASHIGTLGWRGLDNNTDVWSVAVTPGSDGMKVWYRTPFDTRLITDHGEAAPPLTFISTGPQSGGSGTSTMRVDATGHCLSGISATTASQNPISPGTSKVVTPWSMVGIAPGALVFVDTGIDTDIVTAGTVTATTFTADFLHPHSAGAFIKVFSGVVVRIDQTGSAGPVSQVFGNAADVVKAIAVHPTDDQFAVCITGKQQATPDQRVWMTSGVPLGPTTVWSEITAGKPSGGLLSSAAIDGSGKVYVIFTDLGTLATPLYEVSTGSWIAQAATGLPAGRYGSIVVRPGATDTLYISCGAQVYEVRHTGSTWTWTATGSGLPGQPVVDVWIGNAGTSATPKLLLRAAVVTRGVWEADVTSFATTPDPPTRPYFRHHALDQGWLSPSIEGQVDPFNPTVGPGLYHWESPDIRIDAQQAGSPAFYQTDPEEPLPISHVAYDRLIDNSENLPQSDLANVHVQVHNRSYTALDNVAVWAVFTRVSATVPSLAASPSLSNNFQFWKQFHADGTIVPSLPSDSPWQQASPPTTVSGLAAASPQVASFAGWTIPTLLPGDPGHYCMVAFAHSKANPINETSFSVDAIAVSNPQVAQKNLHVTTMHPIAHLGFGLRDFVEFHNPSREELTADLVIDLRELPKQVRVLVQWTSLEERVKIAGGAQVHDDAPELVWMRHWADRFEDAAERDYDDRRRRGHRQPLPRFAPRVWAVHPSSAFEVLGVRLPPFGSAAAIFTVTTQDRSLLHRDLRFRVLQRVSGHVVGGSTWWIRPR